MVLCNFLKNDFLLSSEFPTPKVLQFSIRFKQKKDKSDKKEEFSLNILPKVVRIKNSRKKSGMGVHICGPSIQDAEGRIWLYPRLHNTARPFLKTNKGQQTKQKHTTKTTHTHTHTHTKQGNVNS
jgi:hypothetical protein